MGDINKELSPDVAGVEVREPAAVYGYFSLVDPGTGERHYPMDYDRVPPAPVGYPEYFAVVFRAVDGKETRRVEFRAMTGYDVAIDPLDPNQVRLAYPSVARLYYFPLIQDRSEADRDPRYIDDDRLRHDVIPHPSHTIRYNPDRWRFATVEVGPWDLRDPDGTMGGPDATRYQDQRGEWHSQIPLTPRAEPFPDLPDLPCWEWEVPPS